MTDETKERAMTTYYVNCDIVRKPDTDVPEEAALLAVSKDAMVLEGRVCARVEHDGKPDYPRIIDEGERIVDAHLKPGYSRSGRGGVTSAPMARVVNASRTDAQREASARYRERMIRQVNLQLNIKTDADIIEWLDSQPNKSGAIKALIRKGMHD